MNNNEDLYHILGLNRDATEKEIKSAYRKKVKECHPDTGGDEEVFKKVSYSYEILSDTEKKSLYDKYGHSGIKNGAPPPKNPFSGFGNPFSGFGNPFGMNKGRTIVYNLEITLEESFFGVNKNININKTTLCNHCEGNGGTEPIICNQCNGNGATQQGNFFYMCNNCGGNGVLFSKKCNYCHSSGIKNENKVFSLKLPRGILNNTQILKQGFGNEVKDGINGDILINVTVKKDPIFDVEGMDLKAEIAVPILDIFLGTEVDFKTMDGDVKIKIPRLSDPNKLFRLKNKGMVNKNNQRGDLLLKLIPNYPKNISPQEEALINALKNSPNFSE
jgi:molecular chaperone DnaJ